LFARRQVRCLENCCRNTLVTLGTHTANHCADPILLSGSMWAVVSLFDSVNCHISNMQSQSLLNIRWTHKCHQEPFPNQPIDCSPPVPCPDYRPQPVLLPQPHTPLRHRTQPLLEQVLGLLLLLERLTKKPVSASRGKSSPLQAIEGSCRCLINWHCPHK
jgi:hypothetical protein